jgi:hypothetical protein
MQALSELQKWYFSQCNEDWEHTYGIEIGNLDNPGWFVKIDLQDTELEESSFATYEYGTGEEGITSGNEWLICKVESKKFIGYGGPFKLEEIINVFLSWANENA